MEQPFDACTEEEMAIFDRIASGEPPAKFDPEIVQKLLNLRLLDDHAGFVTVSYYILSIWEKTRKPPLAKNSL